MDSSTKIIAGAGLTDRDRKSRWPARFDFAQSASGLLLVLFMWGHMFFVSSILHLEDAMWTITKFFEGYFLFGTSYPAIVSIVVAAVILLFAGHAFLALRKFPAQLPPARDLPGTHARDAPRGHDAVVLAGLHRALRCSSSRPCICT